MLYNSRRRRTAGSVVPLGFVLVVAIITIGLAVFNTTAIPILSQSAEVDSHRATATDFIRMDATISRAVTTNIPQPIVVIERITYPPSLTPINKPSPHLRASKTAEIRIQNARNATTNGTALTETRRETNHILYSREYNFYENARLLGLEHGVFYTQSTGQDGNSNNTLIRNGQRIVNGKTINIIAVDSSMSFSKPSPTQVNIRSKDSDTLNVDITNQANESIKIRLPTRIPEDKWKTMLNGERVKDDGSGCCVEKITYNNNPEDFNRVTLTLKAGQDYELNMYTVKVDQRTAD
jgi:hypothetical protein